MKTIESVAIRERLLIKIYNEYGNYSAFNLKKEQRKKRASRLLRELRERYNSLPIFTPYIGMNGLTPEMVSGGYSLD